MAASGFAADCLANQVAQIFKTSANNSPSPRMRVALFGIAQRIDQVKYTQIKRKLPGSKPLPLSIKTLGDWIQVKRMEKNLTLGHVALKMGIATSLVCSWESTTRQPDSQQLEDLSSILGVNAKDFETFTNKQMNLPCVALKNQT